MNLQYRIELLARLRTYLLSDTPEWVAAQERAFRENGWFTPEFVAESLRSIAENYLDRDKLQEWVSAYQLPDLQPRPRKVGIVMAGNIPLVGFHDWVCCFVAGHHAVIKLSSKDAILLPHLLAKLTEWEPAVANSFTVADFLKGCDAYIATGSNNSAGYFEYYFARYPHIIRRNRTSVAVLTGQETVDELKALATDVHLYFGLGCRNVTHLLVPENYDFVPLLEAFRIYQHLEDHHKYKNNYDYNLALHILNNKFYMTNGSVLLIEDAALFSPVSQVHYSYHADPAAQIGALQTNPEVQAVMARQATPFGQSQKPALSDYADAVDTLAFLQAL